MRNREQQMIDAGNLAAARRVLAESQADSSDWECLREEWMYLGIWICVVVVGAAAQLIWGIWIN